MDGISTFETDYRAYYPQRGCQDKTGFRGRIGILGGENEKTVSPPNFLGNSGSFWNDKQAGNRGIAPYYLSLVET
jgi:hypothetical protein